MLTHFQHANYIFTN